MTRAGRESGFSFVELVVVITLIAVLVSFSIPLFRDARLFSGKSENASGLALLIRSLKTRAVELDRDFFLHMDLHSGRVWVTDSAMDTSALEKAGQEGITYGDGLRIINLEFPGERGRDRNRHTLCFRRQGYSDRALIHLRDKDEDITLEVRTFLTRVERFDRYVSYDDCI
ncbi:MAG: prepilin-type N-terminal cleavage/methylation domain-containing protein [Desulfobacteraceae bacterium]|nr:prepilin-type N-terminal cleavage/methylation domain-containing protein [Desulfobacteraceae bacterium]